VTATVESIPLISASIMSKKLAEGSDALVLDVKCGDGAFMKTRSQARALAESMVAIGRHAGVRTEAFITEMEAPLGHAIGNALEVIECLETLKGRGPAELTAVVKQLGARMVALGGGDDETAGARVDAALTSGQALARFAQLVERQGGDPRIVDDYGRLPAAPDRAEVVAPRSGYITSLRAESLGIASNLLGAGRTRVGDPVDHAVGIVTRVKIGDEIRAGELLVELHHRAGRGVADAVTLCAGAIDIGDQPPPRREHVIDHVT
jgi:pyrimidine-nucleoside phosphorylase